MAAAVATAAADEDDEMTRLALKCKFLNDLAQLL
jgi:hypothetical protein